MKAKVLESLCVCFVTGLDGTTTELINLEFGIEIDSPWFSNQALMLQFLTQKNPWSKTVIHAEKQNLILS